MPIQAQHGAPPRNSWLALAMREATGREAVRPDLPRRSLSLRQVVRQEEGGVLMGFSSDGNFLVYCLSLDSRYEVQWRRLKFQDFYQWREDGEPPETALTLRVGGGSSAYGVSAPLEVWQSADQALVLAISTDSLAEDRESLRLSRAAVAPSPMFDGGGHAAAVTSLSFELSQHALSQKLEKWQLLQLVRGPSALNNVYHLLVNAGTAVQVLVLYCWRRKVEELVSRADKAILRGLGISHFPQNAWYYPPVFPIKFQKSTEHRPQYATSDGSFSVGVEVNADRRSCGACLTVEQFLTGAFLDVDCQSVCQQLFDVERFLGEFLATFKPLQQYNLIDYDLRLVRASTTEKTVFMICVVTLAPPLTPSEAETARPGTRHLRVTLFLSLELFTGDYHIIRALKVPGNGDLRQLSQVVARRFLTDLNARLSPEQAASAWDNEAFLREESLHELHNPLYPLSISRR